LNSIGLTQLSSMAIAEVRLALTDESRMISDPLVAAIAHLASYEALFGTRTICTTHMEGLSALVSTRGGLAALGSDSQVKQIILWTVSNASGYHMSATILCSTTCHMSFIKPCFLAMIVMRVDRFTNASCQLDRHALKCMSQEPTASPEEVAFSSVLDSSPAQRLGGCINLEIQYFTTL
jgi:hypothetical protein